MNEEEIQRKRRQNEEEATERRARILGLVYLDTREFENDIPLVTNLIDKEQMHKDRIIPLQEGDGGKPYQFMITSNTPRHLLEEMITEYEDDGKRIYEIEFTSDGSEYEYNIDAATGKILERDSDNDYDGD